jgi:hypothetical protein
MQDRFIFIRGSFYFHLWFIYGSFAVHSRFVLFSFYFRFIFIRGSFMVHSRFVLFSFYFRFIFIYGSFYFRFIFIYGSFYFHLWFIYGLSLTLFLLGFVALLGKSQAIREATLLRGEYTKLCDFFS